MALVFMEGFESQYADEFQHGVIASNGRYTGSTWLLGAAAGAYYPVPGFESTLTQFTLGFAILRGSNWVSSNLLGVAFNGTNQLHFACSATNALQLYRSSGNVLLYESAPSFLVNNAWYYIELSATLATGATGSWELRVNGQTLGSGSSVITAATTNTMNQVSPARGNQSVWVDDFYVTDTANDFKGEVSIVGMFPNGNGNYSQLTGSDGNSTDNYLLVDEVPPSSADYVGSSVDGNKDTYTMSDLPSGTGNILAVQTQTIAAKTQANLKRYRTVLRSGGTDEVSSDVYVGATYVQHGVILETSPFTATAWTESELNAMEFGIEVRP